VKGRRIYVDIDDVLSETIECLIDLLEVTHERRIAVEDVRHFDLEKSFGLEQHEIEAFMERAHADDVIESIPPTAGAAEILSDWAGAAHEVMLVTGRPPSTNAASRRWLETHSIEHTALHHLDKWSRPSWNHAGLPALRFEEIPAFEFDFAVEDSLDTAVRLVEDFGIPVALMDRPWNRDLGGLSSKARGGLARCSDWRAVADVFARG
jgi:uncharacterized HAD superfamily protein